jgi:3-hydroxyacyl-CoA dehydrogenase/enoyl-CoA hydratase/3-hydroxybutyryl-CoA epimerase
MAERDIEDRLFTALVNESARCLRDGIVKSPGLLDLAMVYGTGFPAFRGGPLREAEKRGLPEVVRRALELASRYGTRLSPPETLLKMASEREAFYAREAGS